MLFRQLDDPRYYPVSLLNVENRTGSVNWTFVFRILVARVSKKLDFISIGPAAPPYDVAHSHVRLAPED
jgi:hypothetical protein